MSDPLAALVRARSGAVHFVGVGGVGMAGLAYQFARQGLAVTGSDAAESRITAWLRQAGCQVVVGHRADHLPEAARWVVRTPAVAESNPEIGAARQRGLPVFARGDVLAAWATGFRTLAVAGAHGKTTTSSWAAWLLHRAGKDPSFCVGGEFDLLGGVAGRGAGDWLVVEADESDGTLARYAPEVLVLTRVDLDHLEHFRGWEDLTACYARAVGRTSGAVVAHHDDPATRAIADQAERRLTFGRGEGASVRIRSEAHRFGAMDLELTLPDGTPVHAGLNVGGPHNADNAAAAVAGAWAAGLHAPSAIADGLASFRLPRRRFDLRSAGDDVLIVSDYAHHPEEIRALIRQAAASGRRLLGVFQPHRYSRTAALAEAFPPSFRGLDWLGLVPVYAASEAPRPGGTSADLAARFRDCAEAPPCQLFGSPDEALRAMLSTIRSGDLVLVIGAGDVETMVPRLAHGLDDQAAGRSSEGRSGSRPGSGTPTP